MNKVNTDMKPLWEGTIFGEPASKANSRRLVSFKTKTGRRPASIKSAKALSYLDGLKFQVPVRTPLIGGDIEISMVIHYASRRPDLDPSLILDALQGRVIVNDRQVRRLVIDGAVDKANPRTQIVIRDLPDGHVSRNQGCGSRKALRKA